MLALVWSRGNRHHNLQSALVVYSAIALRLNENELNNKIVGKREAVDATI
jgi:hypothetical protein